MSPQPPKEAEQGPPPSFGTDNSPVPESEAKSLWHQINNLLARLGELLN